MTTINLRVNEDLKAQANTLFEELGLDMTTAITLFLKQSVTYGGIPFAIQKPRWAFSSKEELTQKLDEAEKSIKNGAPTISHNDFWGNVRSQYGKDI